MRNRNGSGFTLIELLVVVAIMMVLIGMIMGAVALVRQQQRRVLASKQVHDIVSACEAYFMVLHQYPLDTGFVELDGTTTPFTKDESTSPSATEANAIYLCLGRKIYESASDSKFGSFLVIHPTHLRNIGGMEIMVDPWGSPYRMDCVHVAATTVAITSGDADYVAADKKIERVGAPYANQAVCDECTQTVSSEKRTFPVKAWSVGPDKAEGADPFSHVEKITIDFDQDNVSSWK
jgi:type II secretory pathway pseudopilin PulG